MKINKKIASYCAAAVAAVLILIIVALPPIIRHVAVNKIDEATGRKSEIAKVSINPFTLTAGVYGVRLSEKGSNGTFLSLSSARVSLSPLSLPKRSFIISELKLSAPYVHVVRNAPNNFNFTDLLTGKKEKKEEKSGGTPLFSLNNIVIENGNVDFDDKALAAERFHRLRKIAISIPFFSNMPYLADRYVTPHFAAIVNGSPFDFKGRLKPLTHAVEATVDVNVKQVDLPFYLGYVPVPLPVKVDSGKLTSEMEVGYRVDAKTGPELRVAGNLVLDRLAARELSGAPLASLEQAQLKMNNLWLMSQHFDVASLDLSGLELYASRDRNGVTNFQRLGNAAKPAEPASKEAKAKPAPAKPVDLKLGRFSLRGGKVHFADAVPKGGFKTDLNEIEIGLRNFSLLSDHKAPFTFRLRSARGETISLDGEVAPKPMDVKATLAVNGIRLKDYYPYLADTLAAPVSGTLDVDAGILFNERQGLLLEKGALKTRNLAAPFGGGDGVSLKEADISGIGLDLKQNKATVARIDLKGGNMALTGEKDGTLSLQRLLKAKPAAAPAKPKAKPAKKKARGKETAAPPFSYRIDKIAGSDFKVRYLDKTKEDEPSFVLKRLQFSLASVTGPKMGAIPFSVATGFGDSGRIKAAGSVTPQPLKFKGNVELLGIALRDFDAYLPENTTVFIADGALDTKMAVDLQKDAGGLKGSFAGSAGVRSFYCQDSSQDEDLLKWERLQIENIKGTLGPFTLAIKDVSLSNFFSRIVVEKDGTLNVQHLMGEEAPVAATAKPAPPLPTVQQSALATPPGPTGGQTAAQPSPISIDAITMQGGTLSFSDRHLQNPFDTTFFNLGGRVSGLTSKASEAADVDLRGNLENHSPLAITGKVNPLRGDLFLDMKVAFNDIELSPFTPYSDTYLGYNVDKGKLFLDLTYHIEKKTLSSENKVFVDQFTFGKAVESQKATKLPVRLAIALLKDRKGEIHLDLPVTGRIDDPQFSVWKVVIQILKNMLVKAATAPFALLSSMFGGHEDFSAVYFAPGADDLSQAEQDKLAKLAKALHDRPAISLEISGFVDKERDPEGYRNELLLKKMKGEKFRALAKQKKLAEGQTQEGTAILPGEYHEYLKAVYQKEKFPKPRNIVGIAKDLPDDEMKKLIVTHTTVGNVELQGLARERAQAVKDFLQTKGSVPTERLFETSADIYKPQKEAGSAARVEFGAKVK